MRVAAAPHGREFPKHPTLLSAPTATHLLLLLDHLPRTDRWTEGWMEGWKAAPGPVLSHSHSGCRRQSPGWQRGHGEGRARPRRAWQLSAGARMPSERGAARLPADSSAQMFQQGLSAATGDVARGTAGHDRSGRLRAWACVHSTRHGRPPTACTRGTATRSPLSVAGRGGAGGWRYPHFWR